MGRFRGGGPRSVRAAVAAGAVMLLTPAGPALAADSGHPAPGPGVAAPTTTTTLPALPKISPAYTAGQPPASLLSNAIALSSLGLDDSALMSAVSATQVKLDADAQAASRAEDEAAQAARLEAEAAGRADAAQARYTGMATAIRQAVLQIYTTGPAAVMPSPRAGALAVYAQDYADSALAPYGVLAQSRTVEHQRTAAALVAEKEARLQAAASARAARALTDQQTQLERLRRELSSASAASATAVAADHVALASEAGKELLSASALEFDPKKPLPAPVSTTPVALTWAFAELGRQYVWGATGPKTFDCSGLTQFAWKAAGVSIPRVAADQDGWTVPVPLSQLLPGDLVFFGTTDIHHVGMYIGDGLMINAPHTGTVVQVSSIWWSDLAGFGRVHYPGTPVPPHGTPTAAQPAVAVVVPTAGPVPSQPKPPPGWKPKPGSTTPIRLGLPELGTGATTTTTSSTSTSTSTSSTTTSSTTVPADPSTTSSTAPPDSSPTTATSAPPDTTAPGA